MLEWEEVEKSVVRCRYTSSRGESLSPAQSDGNAGPIKRTCQEDGILTQAKIGIR